jgi:hypothetical protein
MKIISLDTEAEKTNGVAYLRPGIPGEDRSAALADEELLASDHVHFVECRLR